MFKIKKASLCLMVITILGVSCEKEKTNTWLEGSWKAENEVKRHIETKVEYDLQMIFGECDLSQNDMCDLRIIRGDDEGIDTTDYNYQLVNRGKTLNLYSLEGEFVQEYAFKKHKRYEYFTFEDQTMEDDPWITMVRQ